MRDLSAGKRAVYLDNAATTFIKPLSVRRAVMRAMAELTSPGRGGYAYAQNAADEAFLCRERAARLFNMDKPENVVFTFNATHALNIAIFSAVPRGGRAVVTGFEHNSVMRPLYALGAEVIIARAAPFDRDAALESFFSALRSGADAAVVNYASNVFGCVFPVYEAAEICRERGIPLIVDASQAAGALPVDFKRLGAEFIAMPGHKGLYGLQGTGLLLCKGTPKPLLFGGTGSASLLPGMPDMLPDIAEAGTHNMPGIAALSAGLSFVIETGAENILKAENRLINYAAHRLSHIPGVTVYRPENAFGAGVMAFNIDGLPSETAAQRLSERGIAVRAGLHCSPEAHRTAGTLPGGAVRVSVSAFTRRRDIGALLRAVSLIAHT